MLPPAISVTMLWLTFFGLGLDGAFTDLTNTGVAAEPS
jgi:hypothetical protein